MAERSKELYTFLSGHALLLIWTTNETTFRTPETELNDWWTNEHIPERLAIEGFLRARRYYAPNRENQGPPSHYLVWYEVVDSGTLKSRDYLDALNSPTEGTIRNLPSNMERSACEIMHTIARPEFRNCRGNGVGTTLAHLRFTPPSSQERRESLKRFIVNDLSPSEHQIYDSLIGFHLLEHNPVVTRAGNATSSYEDVGVNMASVDEERWDIALEFAEPMSAPFARHRSVIERVTKHLMDPDEGQVDDVYCRVYELVCAISDMPLA